MFLRETASSQARPGVCSRIEGLQLLGHSSYNYALRLLPATYVGVISLAEPVGTSILAFFLLNELPPLLTLLGATVILIGIAIASWPDRTR